MRLKCIRAGSTSILGGEPGDVGAAHFDADLVGDFQVDELVVNPALPVHSVEALVALARANPGKYTFGSSGLGGLSHLAGALFGSLAGIDLTHVPYKGGALAMSDVISGQIDMLFSTILQSHGHLASGRLRGLAVTTAQRSPSMPEMPTMEESGVKDYELAGWYGVVAPAETPVPILDKLNTDIVAVLRTPEMRERLAVDGSEPVGNTREQFGAFIRSEIAKWRKAEAERLTRLRRPDLWTLYEKGKG